MRSQRPGMPLFHSVEMLGSKLDRPGEKLTISHAPNIFLT